MTLLLGVDIETTGVDQKLDKITELGMVIVDTEFKDPSAEYIPVDIFNKLINCPNRPAIHKEAYEINHITEEMLQKWGLKPNKQFCDFVASYFNKVDYVVACNGNNFDRPILEKFFKSYGCTLPDKVWIDTQKDIDYPDSVKQRNQTYVAGYYGTHNPIPHRTVTDVLMMFKLMGAFTSEGLNFDLNKIISNATAVKIKIAANVSFDEKEMAKSDKFRWDADGSDCGRAKTWWKEIRDSEYDPENYPFATEILKDNK